MGAGLCALAGPRASRREAGQHHAGRGDRACPRRRLRDRRSGARCRGARRRRGHWHARVHEPGAGVGRARALGAVGYFALSGKLPFEAEKATDVLAKQVTEPAPPLASVAGVPRRLAQAIDRCLAKDPAERPQTGEALAEQLGLALEQRRELPVGLRVFVKRNARLGGVGGLIYVISIPFIMGFVGSLFRRGDAVLWTFAAAITVVPFGILLGRARRFLTSGFGPEDLAAAFRADLEHGREERIFEYGRGPSLYERVLRVVGLG